MNLLEHEAKRLLDSSGVTTPESSLWQADDPEPANFPIVLKSQVPVGGRGKLGGVKIVEHASEFPKTAENILKREIKGFSPKALLIEEKLAIKRELYLSIMVDRESSSIQIVAHPEGGIEIESHEPGEFFKTELNQDLLKPVAVDLTDFFETPEISFVLEELLKNLLNCLVKNDALLIEINPLVITDDSKLIAGDAKMTLDDAAAFRHPDWDFESMGADNNFVTLDQNGQVATIANGAGLAMATVDAVKDAGMTPANFLDIGGGASSESVLQAFKKIMEYPKVAAIVINIFAGITRCDEVAKAIIIAKNELPELPELHIRLAGTNFEAAKVLLDNEQIPLLPTLADCLASAKGAIS